MHFIRPRTLAEALAAKAEHPGAVPIAGGTDVMVELNFNHRRPPALLDLNRVGELHEHGRHNGGIRLGAAVSYARIIAELGTDLPGLAMAARTVGSPQIRNRGNLGAASPAGDSHPALVASGADVETRPVPWIFVRRSAPDQQLPQGNVTALNHQPRRYPRLRRDATNTQNPGEAD